MTGIEILGLIIVVVAAMSGLTILAATAYWFLVFRPLGEMIDRDRS